MAKINKKIYLDYAATTPVDKRVLRAMRPYFFEKFGNASSLHCWGEEAKSALEQSRQAIARFLNAESDEIFFTSSATESNNLALKGAARANKNKGKHLIISSIEHDCVLNSAQWLEKQGFKITRLQVDKNGLVNPEEVRKAIKKDTILVSIMHANNEVGTIQPIKEISQFCQKKGVLFHTDAAQTFGKIPIDVRKMKINLLTASSHKMYGPKGAALLYVEKGVKIEPLLHGGGHERGLRSSTSNVAAIVGFARAAELCFQETKKENRRLENMRDKLIKTALKTIPDSYLDGHPRKRLANNVNLRFDFVEGEAIMLHLDSYGIGVSTGSACASDHLEPSHVLLALGLNPGQAHGSIRISLGRWTTQKDINYLLKVLPEIIKNLRKISPFK